MKLTTSGIILWAVLAILIGIMLGKNEDNSTQFNIAHTGNSVQQVYVYTADTLRYIKGKVDHDRWFKNTKSTNMQHHQKAETKSQEDQKRKKGKSTENSSEKVS